VDHSAAVLVAKYLCIGFSGARKPAPASLTALKWLSRHVPPNTAVMVGCAAGLVAACPAWYFCPLAFLPLLAGGFRLSATAGNSINHQPIRLVYLSSTYVLNAFIQLKLVEQ